MSEPTIPYTPETETPEPVLRQAAVQSVVTSVGTAAVALGTIVGADLTAVQDASVIAAGAIVVLVNAVATAYTSWRARAQVTPV